jgi:GT2 family glycosyltransferase
MKSISIIIVNWNSGYQLLECITSIGLARQIDFVLSEVVIVDNNSSDNSIAHVKAMTDLPFQLKIISNFDNKGFGAACNQGAAAASGDYLLFLNPDTRLFEDSLSIPLAFMQRPENIDVGIVGIQLIDENNHVARSCARFPNLMMYFVQSLGMNRLQGLRQLSVHMIEWSHDTTKQVDHVIGAFFLMQRSLFKSLGCFDERFFVYLEDLDLSLRAHQGGWRSIYLAEAQAFHAEGGTSRQVKARRLFYSLRSRILFVFKHFNPFSATLVLLTALLIEPFSRSVLAISRGSWVSLKETWAAYGMLLRWLPDWVLKGVTR